MVFLDFSLIVFRVSPLFNTLYFLTYLCSRTNKSVLSSKRFDEFVSAFHVDEDRNIIIAASGEGTIQAGTLPPPGREPYSLVLLFFGLESATFLSF